MRNIRSAYPWDDIAIDLAEPTRRTTAKGNNFILVVVCALTRFVVLRAIPDKKATTVAYEMWSIFADFGIPLSVMSDNGGEFANRVSEQIAKLLGIDLRVILPNNPRSNGIAEAQVKQAKLLVFKRLSESANGPFDDRLDQELDDAAKARSDVEDRYEWDVLLPGIQMGLNSKVAKLTKSAPHELFTARPRNPFGAFTESKSRVPLSPERLKRKNEQMLQIIYPSIAQRTKKFQEGYSKRADKKRLSAEKFDFRPGTIVMRRNMRKKRKSDDTYLGPFRIARVIEGAAHLVYRDTGIGLDRAVPFDQLKWVEAPPIIAGADSAQQPGSGIFTIASIVDHKVENGTVKYLIRWVGFHSDDATWEPISSLEENSTVVTYWKSRGKSLKEGVKGAIKDWKDNQKKKSRKRKR
jgi:hypothetical protein